jgi:protoporphyrinogen oxidase
MDVHPCLVLGAGVTGLAAARAGGLEVLEATRVPGGICRSYYLAADGSEPLAAPPRDGRAWRFEVGGGHWLFGGDPVLLDWLDRLAPLQRYERRAAVYFARSGLTVPYPLQNHLAALGREVAISALAEMARPVAPARTLGEWLRARFGPTLFELFFGPFHERYTAGLLDRIAPQDDFKSPHDFARALEGAFGGTAPVGYNATFAYPRDGLDALARALAAGCRIAFDREVVRIDPGERTVHCADGSARRYGSLLSSLPLARMLELTGLTVDGPPDPYTSILVLNIGARRGPRCPSAHWLYVPDSASGFHRVGFYGNVAPAFLPQRADRDGLVSLYVERAWLGGTRPSAEEIVRYRNATVAELQGYGFISTVEVWREDWIEVAYTWSWPRSNWRARALDALRRHRIHQIGRYGRWVFQGIADSIREGLVAGNCMR